MLRRRKWFCFLLAAYMLPYPGLMPGNKLYRFKKIWDKVFSYWSFGSFAQHKYNLALADKKLVEAKILFEYQQYPLALRALSDSNKHWQESGNFLEQAGKEGKDISRKQENFQSASGKHQEILLNLKKSLPEEFLWQPEKVAAQNLEIKKILDEAVELRNL